VSDGLDGVIARRMDQKSVLGSYLDPVADKVLIMSLSLTCAGADLLPWWAVALIILRDSCLVSGAYVIARREAASRGLPLFASTIQSDTPLEIRATGLSKVNTALQLGLITTAIAGAAFPASHFAYAVPALSYTTSATTLASMADYIRRPGVATVSRNP
jgi:cardiolipin synthase